MPRAGRLFRAFPLLFEHSGDPVELGEGQPAVTFLGWELDLERLEAELMIPCFNLAQTIVLGLLTLLTDRTRKHRPAAALRRLRRYAGLEDDHVPLPEQAEALIRAGLDRRGLLGPWRETVLQDLSAEALAAPSAVCHRQLNEQASCDQS